MTTPRSEAGVTRLLWREQLRLLPGALRAQIRRLLRREPRWYIVVDGRVAGRMASAEGHDAMLQWMAASSRDTFWAGVETGRRTCAHNRADAGEPGTA